MDPTLHALCCLTFLDLFFSFYNFNQTAVGCHPNWYMKASAVYDFRPLLVSVGSFHAFFVCGSSGLVVSIVTMPAGGGRVGRRTRDVDPISLLYHAATCWCCRGICSILRFPNCFSSPWPLRVKHFSFLVSTP